ncbi:MAG: carboxy terminal-processing peptidase [Kiritimatiellae bacterium]|nr:carboxy terminal-processing peptidase [Kiritimatiellia bacterium]
MRTIHHQQKQKQRIWLTLALLTTAFGLEGVEAPLAPEPLYSEIARRVAAHLPQEHITRAPFDDAISSRLWTNFITGLDYDRTYFLQSDIDRFKLWEEKLDDMLKQGDLQFAYDVFNLYRERVRNRCQYVEKLLGENKLNLETPEVYQWNRKNARWPGNEDEWDELWRKRIKNDLVRRTVAKMVENTRKKEGTVSNSDTNRTPESVLQRKKPRPDLPVAQAIIKNYRQYLTVLEDSPPDLVLRRFLTALAQAYDPHSGYMSPSDIEDFDIEMKLSLVGIGALLRSQDGAAEVVRLIPGGPADRDKRDIRLQPGDKIIAVADGDGPPVDILHWPLEKIVRLIRGKKGTRVVLTVIPASDQTGTTTKRVDLIRDEVKLEEQAAKSEIRRIPAENGETRVLGIISLPAFYANMRVFSTRDSSYRSSAQDVANILNDMRQQGVEGVLLDLRNNGGGSLIEAVRMTGLFIRTGPTVQVYERSKLRILPDRDPSVAFDGPLVVIVNRLSASASEIVAGALQDYGRAVIVGDSKTHGKGTVQSIIELGRDTKLGSLKVTTAVYYRISGASTQLRGISPDIEIQSPFDLMQIGEDSLPNPLPWGRVPATEYDRWDNLADVIGILREKSERRRAADPRFVAYRDLLARIAEMQKTDTLPLDLPSRLKMAQTEKELADLQTRLLEETPEGDEPKRDGSVDLVLEESLRILADLVALKLKKPSVGQVESQNGISRPSISQDFAEWLRGKR